MISTDFAPNETWSDAWISTKLLFQPWRWKKGKDMSSISRDFLSQLQITNDKLQITFFLSGRSALYNLLQAFELPKNSEVLVQAFTCEAVVLPIIATNLKPSYVDIETQTFSMDYNDLTNKLRPKDDPPLAETNHSRVLILQHTFGLTPKFRKKILEFTKKNNLIVIEDLAHGFDPRIFKSNNLTANSYYLLSFGRSKPFSSVFGGAILSFSNGAMKQFNNLPYPSYSFIFRCLIYKPLVMLIKSTYDIYIGQILHKLLNLFNLLIPEISGQEKMGKFDRLLDKILPNGLAVLLQNQLVRFEHVQKTRSYIVSYYSQHLKSMKYELLRPKDDPPLAETTNYSLIRYPLLIENRDRILEKGRQQNIFLGKWYDQVVAPKDIDLNRVRYIQGDCPVAEEICKKIINLPTNISRNEAEKIVNVLNDVT